jgi:hypothetical protein
MLPEIRKPYLQFIFVSEFGDKSEVKIDLIDGSMESLYPAIQQALAGCGFSQDTIREWFQDN